jgi:hypothetical protein
MSPPATAPAARVIHGGDPTRSLRLDPRRPLTIGRDPANRLCLPAEASLSRRHAEIRVSTAGDGWQLCDLGSANGTFVGAERVEGCRALVDGDVLRLGRRGPVLVFRLEPDPARVPAPAPRPGVRAAAPQPGIDAGGLDIGGHRLPLDHIRTVEVRSRRVHPHMFSWWVLAALGGLLLLPFPWLFWLWEAIALAGAVALGARRRHTLVVVLQDGRAERRSFAHRGTALSHRNGIRRAIGQSPSA